MNAHLLQRLLLLVCIFLLLPVALQETQAQHQAKIGQANSSAAKLVEEGYALSTDGKLAEAVETFKRAINVNPKYIEAYSALGDAYLNLGKGKEALAVYKEAVRIAPSNAVAQYNLGYYYNFMGRHGEAFRPLVAATALDPNFAEAYYEIGYAYLRGNQFEKSISFLRSAIRLNSNYADAHYGLALALTRLRKLEAAEVPRRALLALDANLIKKLDQEIKDSPLERAGPLPPITPALPVNDRVEPDRIPTESQQIVPAITKTVTSSPSPPTEMIPQTAGVVGANTNEQSSKSSPQQASSTTPLSSSPVSVSTEQPTPAPAPSTDPASSRRASSGPISTWPDKTKRWAIVIGVENYSQEQISKFSGAASDAQALASALVQYAGFPANQVILLATDQPPQMQPRRSTILRYLSKMRGMVPKDGLLLFAFTGHGIENSGRSYLLPSDALTTADASLLEDTTININRVMDSIRATETSQAILILDAWRNDPTLTRNDAANPLSSGFSKGFTFDLSNPPFAFAALFATGVGQRAYGDGVKKQGYFTSQLIEALMGQAANEKGEITLANLSKYIQETVPRNVQRDLGSQQTPLVIIEGYKSHDLVIAVTNKTTP